MKNLKFKLPSFENIKKSDKYQALFRDITAMEYILICIPFIISLISIPSAISLLAPRGEENYSYAFVIVALVYIGGLGIIYLFGLRWRFLYFLILLIFSLSIIFIIGKPWEYNLTTDRDEAIRIGIEAILNGKFPYYSKTSLGNSPSILPFTFFFYIPIYLLTNGPTFFMNMIILSIFCIVVFYKFIDTDQDYLVLPVIAFIIFSDWFFIDTAINSDIVNSGLIFCMILLLIPDTIPTQKIILKYFEFTPEKPKYIDKKIIIFAILFGCLLAMKIYFWLIGILIALFIMKIYGFKNTFYLGLLTIVVALCWILPIMLLDVNYFLFESPLGVNAGKFSRWRSYDSVHPLGYIILNFLNSCLNFGLFNGIIISFLIILVSILLGILKCRNKLHLLLIVTFCYLIFLFFYFHGPYHGIVRDYVSIAAIPFIFSLLYIKLDDKKELETQINLKKDLD